MAEPSRRLVVVSNRVGPIASGKASEGGLAVALRAALETSGGLWFGYSGSVAEQPSETPTVETAGNITAATHVLQPIFQTLLRPIDYRSLCGDSAPSSVAAPHERQDPEPAIGLNPGRIATVFPERAKVWLDATTTDDYRTATFPIRPDGMRPDTAPESYCPNPKKNRCIHVP